jgi:hypothetical protein
MLARSSPLALSRGDWSFLLRQQTVVWVEFLKIFVPLFYFISVVLNCIFMQVGPLTAPLSSPRYVSQYIAAVQWQATDRKIPNDSENCPSATSSTTNPMWAARERTRSSATWSQPVLFSALPCIIQIEIAPHLGLYWHDSEYKKYSRPLRQSNTGGWIYILG